MNKVKVLLFYSCSKTDQAWRTGFRFDESTEIEKS